MKQWMAAFLLVGITTCAAGQDGHLRMDKVDPPNWWAQMPKPMLLIRGEGFAGATFTVSDASLSVERTVTSANGHWAQVWLSQSPAQPETVILRAEHGKQVAEASYRFAKRRAATDGFAGFSSADVMYLLMTDRFADGDLTNDGLHATSPADSADAIAQRAAVRGWHGGDLRGVSAHLDYLQQLGITAVWTTPVYQNHEAQSYHGYGATDMYAVDEHYGTLADLQALGADLHKRGMKLVLDTVPNHVGPLHPWVKDSPAPNWFHGTAAHHPEGESDFRALMNPHATAASRKGTLEGWFANALPDMNTDDPAVAQYLRQNAVWWIEQTGADALRIDTFPYVNREFWHDFDAELKELYPQLTEVGEAFSPDPVFVSSYAGGVTRTGVDTGLYTPFDFPTYFALREVFTKGKPMTKLSETLSNDSLYPHPERLPVFLGNHDTSRFREEATEAATRLAFAYVMTSRGMPQIYSGDEIAMRGGGDPDNRRDFPGGFPSSTANAFTAAGRTAEQQRMFAWVAGLAAVRSKNIALQCGGEQILDVQDDSFVMMRDASHAPDVACGPASTARTLVVLNRSSKPLSSKLPLEGTWMEGCRLEAPSLAGKNSSAAIQREQLTLQVGAEDVLIASCK